METVNIRRSLYMFAIALSVCVSIPWICSDTPGESMLDDAHAATVRRINAPYFGGDDVRFSEAAIFWFGQVTMDDNYADVRVGYNDSELYVNLTIIDRLLWYDPSPNFDDLSSYDAVSLYINLDGNVGTEPGVNAYKLVGQLNWWEARTGFEASFQGDGVDWANASIPFSTTSGWRGNAPNDGSDDKGWTLTFHVPFTSLGLSGPPPSNTTWGLALTLHDRDDGAGLVLSDTVWPEAMVEDHPGTWGVQAFGQPSYTPATTTATGIVTIRHLLNGSVVHDGAVGGGTVCGSGLNFWTEWGAANYAGEPRFNIQNQADVADYPCFSKYFVTFPLDAIPVNKVVISASLTLHQFGNAGGGSWGDPYGSFIHVHTLASDWDEVTLTWNNAPLPLENVSSAWVYPISTFPGWPGVPRTWDVSRTVAEAYRLSQPIKLALYSSDSAYNSGKYFVSSDEPDWNEVARPTLEVIWGEPEATGTFADVPLTHWAYDYIETLYAGGYVAGCSSDPLLYCPDRVLSRAESSVFIMRGEHGTIPDPPYPPPGTPTFGDVDPGYWGYGWIESLWMDGFTSGCSTDPLLYCPLREHSRAEGSVFFLRIKNGVQYQPSEPAGLFADVDLNAWYAGWVEAAYNEGILPECGTDPLIFCPEDTLDRSWAAYMMVQAKGLPLP